MHPILTFIPSIIKGVTGFFTKKTELKQASVTAKAKLDLIKVGGKQQIDLTDAEWESLSLKTLTESWKDEYVTIIITIPIPMIILGSVLDALGFPAGQRIVTGTLNGIKELKQLGMDYGFLMNAVVLAAIGIKVWRMK